ncbi:MAG: hypothetical protein ABWX94_02230 [Candidatus Saccharimonadales bacterium]
MTSFESEDIPPHEQAEDIAESEDETQTPFGAELMSETDIPQSPEGLACAQTIDSGAVDDAIVWDVPFHPFANGPDI